MPSSARESRYVAWPAYLVSLAIIVIPIVDALVSLFPWRFGNSPWRFGAVGLISNALLLPVVGLLVLFVVGWIREQRGLTRAIGIFGFVASALCVIAQVAFVLDSLQTRAQVSAEMRLSFNVASITAALKTLLAGVTFFVFGIAGWRLSKTFTGGKSSGAAGEFFTLPTAPSSAKRGETGR